MSLVGLALPTPPGAARGPRHERRRARRQPPGAGPGGARPQRDPALPFPDDSFNAAVCCVSVDYLVRPIEVFARGAAGGAAGRAFVLTFSNRCSRPRRSGAGWRPTTRARRDRDRVLPPGGRLRRTRDPATGDTGAALRGDPLWAVWGTVVDFGPADRRPSSAAVLVASIAVAVSGGREDEEQGPGAAHRQRWLASSRAPTTGDAFAARARRQRARRSPPEWPRREW